MVCFFGISCEWARGVVRGGSGLGEYAARDCNGEGPAATRVFGSVLGGGFEGCFILVAGGLAFLERSCQLDELAQGRGAELQVEPLTYASRIPLRQKRSQIEAPYGLKMFIGCSYSVLRLNCVESWLASAMTMPFDSLAKACV